MNKQFGFTLVEMMVTILVLAVLLGIGVPSFQTMIQRNRLTTVTNDLVGALQFARSEAVRRGIEVTLCSGQGGCSGTWVDGWVVRNQADLDADPYRVWPAVRQGVAVGTPGAVVFNALGAAVGTRCFQISLGAFERRVSVGFAGRIVSINADDLDDIPNPNSECS